MDFLSDPLIPYITLTLGVILVLLKYKPLKLLGLWFICEFACLWFVTGLAEVATADTMVTYRYLYALSAVIFTYHAASNEKTYPKIVSLVFYSIAILTAIDGMYQYLVRSNLEQSGNGFIYEYGHIIDMGYFLIIVGLEILLLALGVTSVLLNNPNSRPYGGIRKQQRRSSDEHRVFNSNVSYNSLQSQKVYK